MAINAARAIGCRVVNIGPDDIMAGSLLTAVAPVEMQHVVSDLVAAVKHEPDTMARAQLIIDAADALGVREFRLLPEDIAKGNEKLNMGFSAAIFNALPGLEAPASDG